MEQILINLVAGALGGVGAGKASPTFDLGTAGNIISGLVGGGVLGQIVTLLLPSVIAAAQSGNLSISGIVSQVIAGGAGGAIWTPSSVSFKRLRSCHSWTNSRSNGSEPPFVQLIVLAIFVLLGYWALRRFHPNPAKRWS